MTSPLESRADLRSALRAEEAALVRHFINELEDGAPSVVDVKALGRKLVAHAKADDSETLIDAFMNRYRLSTEEGVVLMCLAEALLRVPDRGTADALIRDKIAGRDWVAESGESGSRLVDLSGYGLSLGSMTLLLDQFGGGDNPATILKRMIRKSGEPVIRQAALAAMKLLGKQFVMGETIDSAVKRAAKVAKGELCSFDMLGEAARTEADAARYFRAYETAIARIGRGAKSGNPHANHGISVKLSALHPRFEYLQMDRVRDELLPRVVELALQAKAANIPMTLDAEESDRLEPHLDIVTGLVEAGVSDDWSGLGLVVQAYSKRAPELVKLVYALARKHDVHLALRLVKGAYWDTEIKRSQVAGTDYFPVWTAKPHTDLCYLRCAQLLRGMTDHIYPAFATHNAMTIAFVARLFEGEESYELQRLHGMGEGAHDALRDIAKPPRPVRVYAPVGTHKDLLAYLVRRLLENGANSSFVHQFSDPDLTIDDLSIDAREHVGGIDRTIATGAELFLPQRRNSQGYDLGEPGQAEALTADMAAQRRDDWHVGPIVGGRAGQGDSALAVINPATGDPIGQCVEASLSEIDDAIALSLAAQREWSLAGGNFRAERLEKAANLLETQTPKFLVLAMDEAGKTLADAIAELREAVDFLRYYAAGAREHFEQAVLLPGPTGERNELILEGKGLFTCISPWNFPLAIFIGQVGAALAAGNAVLAKPAEQTPIIAHEAVRVLLEAGVPGDVLHFLPGRGEVVGAALTGHAEIAGVVFTGSTEVAHLINRKLASRNAPIATLIAETGGMNAMIVDSTALPEQVARDVVSSAFQSAGQRCSALRVVYLQDEVADHMLEMIAGATAELTVGDPSMLTTDVGPIIDSEAQLSIQHHIDGFAARGRLVVQAVRTGDLDDHGSYIMPTIIRLDAIAEMEREVFGPVLHIVRWKAKNLDAVVDEINATGYGLTLGIHSRIDAFAAHVAAKAQVGNVYVNRNQIGAIVGSQPFGGRGLSGTGPKAGGPQYLLRFAEEKTISTDITAAGGNTALMAGSEGI